MLKRLAQIQKQTWKTTNGRSPHATPRKRSNYQAEISKVVRIPGTEKRLKGASRIIQKMSQDSEFKPSFRDTTALNKIFLTDRFGSYSDQYVDTLKAQNLESGYYEIERYLDKGEYEMAVELLWERYDYYVEADCRDQKKGLDMFRVMKSLRAFQILKEASNRNDTDVILKLINVLGGLGYLTPANYSGVLTDAILHRNGTVCEIAFNNLEKSIHPTQSILKQLYDVFIESEIPDKALDLLPKVEPEMDRKKLALQLISGLPDDQIWEALDRFIISGINVEYDDLSAGFLQLPDLDEFEVISEHLNEMSKLKSSQTRKLVLFSLLSSIDNNQGHIASTVFIIEFLKRSMMLKMLDPPCVDIICHNASKYGSKVTSVMIYDLFEDAGLKLGKRNLLNLMKSESFGTEHEGLYIFAIRYVEKFGKLDLEVREFIERVAETTQDDKTHRFLAHITNLEEAEEIVDYSYLVRNFDRFEDRERVQHEIMKGSGPYRSDLDRQNCEILKRKITI